MTEHPIFYGKPLVFEPKRHMYFWGGEHLPAVTTIIGRLDKPGLVWWAAECAVEHIKKAINFDSPDPSTRWPELYEEARKAHDKIKRSAGDIGTVLHDIAIDVQSYADAKAHVAQLPEEDRPVAWRCASSLKEWLDQQKFGACELERFVVSQDLRYAGKTDRFGVINDRMGVLDYKSGGEKIYPETWLQMAAYETALREELGITEPIWHYAIHLNKKTGVLTPHVRGPQHTGPAREAWRRLVEFDRAMRLVPTEAQTKKVA
jgi:hypothetical protein